MRAFRVERDGVVEEFKLEVLPGGDKPSHRAKRVEPRVTKQLRLMIDGDGNVHKFESTPDHPKTMTLRAEKLTPSGDRRGVLHQLLSNLPEEVRREVMQELQKLGEEKLDVLNRYMEEMWQSMPEKDRAKMLKSLRNAKPGEFRFQFEDRMEKLKERSGKRYHKKGEQEHRRRMFY